MRSNRKANAKAIAKAHAKANAKAIAKAIAKAHAKAFAKACTSSLLGEGEGYITITHSLPHCYEQPTFYPRSTGLLTSKRAEEVAR